jgi:ABC-2 type transport system permease protein
MSPRPTNAPGAGWPAAPAGAAGHGAARPFRLREPGGLLGTLAKALAVLRMGLRKRLAHLDEVVVRSIFLIVVLFVFTQLWRAVALAVDRRPGGYDPAQLVWYLAFTEAIVFSTPNHWDLEVDREVRSGDIAYRIARPLPYPLYHLAASFGDRLLRFAVYLAIGAALALAFAGPIPLRLGAVLAALAAGVLGIVADEIATLTISLGAFWVDNTSGVHLLYRRATMLLGGTFLPLEAYPAWLADVCRALPFCHLVSGPARLFVGPDAGGLDALVAAQLAVIAVAFVPLVLTYTFGLRRIASQGG